MSSKTFEIIVGSNVKTGNLETEKLIEITSMHFDEARLNASMTDLKRKERSKAISVIVKAEQEELSKYIKEIKKVLNLDEVTYHQINKFKKQ